MNTPSANFNVDRRPEGEGGLPTELAGISSLLDALGAAERAMAPAALSGGVALASGRMLNAGSAVGAAGWLADEREALRADGPADLEVSTFEASRPHLTGAAAAVFVRGELNYVVHLSIMPISTQWIVVHDVVQLGISPARFSTIDSGR